MTRKLGIGIGEWKFRIGIGDCGLGLRIRIGDCGHWHGCACTHCIFEPCIYCNLYTFQLSLQDRFCTYDDVTVNIMHFECLCMSPDFRKIFQNCTYWMYGDVMYHHFVFENSWHCQHFMTVDIKCSIISSSSSSVVWSCQIALQFAREKKQRARGKERKKKKNEGTTDANCFPDGWFRRTSAGNAKPILAFGYGMQWHGAEDPTRPGPVGGRIVYASRVPPRRTQDTWTRYMKLLLLLSLLLLLLCAVACCCCCCCQCRWLLFSWLWLSLFACLLACVCCCCCGCCFWFCCCIAGRHTDSSPPINAQTQFKPFFLPMQSIIIKCDRLHRCKFTFDVFGHLYRTLNIIKHDNYVRLLSINVFQFIITFMIIIFNLINWLKCKFI